MVSTARPASKVPSGNGSCSAKARMQGAAAGARCAIITAAGSTATVPRAVGSYEPVPAPTLTTVAASPSACPITRPARRGEKRTIRIWYHAQPKRGMWFLPDGWWYTGFHTEAWLPCDASPADRSTFTVHWIVPAAMSLIGTGDETEHAKLPGDG